MAIRCFCNSPDGISRRFVRHGNEQFGRATARLNCSF
jgi:hypothetical protein